VGEVALPSGSLGASLDSRPPGSRLRRVDAVNTFRCIRRSFHVVSRRFASSFSASQQVSWLFAAGSIPGSSTKKGRRDAALFLCGGQESAVDHQYSMKGFMALLTNSIRGPVGPLQ
jgi:hypothetical protein